ncbi:MAG: NAD(P)-binding domain-containing protein, partial [Saprospiraceae bacterium]|nr:NAD(P)-binding domain-containing protein [Saprospiraceae bacterium]
MKVAVIGAGCSGITAIKNLLSAGIRDVVCFEQNDRVGGNWIYSRESSHSSVMETTHIISSKKLSEYKDYPMPDDYPDYPSHQQILAYFEGYAEHFELKRYIRFNTKVDKVNRDEAGLWQIYTNGADIPETYDFLLVSNGHHSVPRHPELVRKFTGKYFHSHDFKTNEIFSGKRVLVIGGGNSACDCAVEGSRVADFVAISMRRPQYIVPKFMLGKPTDTFNDKMRGIPEWIAEPIRKLSLKLQMGKYEYYGLNTPDFPITKDHPTVNSELLYMLRHGKIKPKGGIEKVDQNRIYFTDGSSDEFDVIVAATGYKISTPFFDPEFLDYEEADDIKLYLRMF